MKVQNELKGNFIEWSLSVLQKEKKFTEANDEIKMAILRRIADNKQRDSVANIIEEIHTNETSQYHLLKELDIIYNQSTLNKMEKDKVYHQAKNQILANKLTNPYVAKGFKCSEWRIIKSQFGCMVSSFI